MVLNNARVVRPLNLTQARLERGELTGLGNRLIVSSSDHPSRWASSEFSE